jgi:N-acetylmuramoyl-L-alanine amidase
MKGVDMTCMRFGRMLAAKYSFVFVCRLAILTFVACPALSSSPPEIQVIYPKEGQRIAAVDSTFILGSVTPGAELSINGSPVEVYRTGGFLAFLPLDTGRFIYHLRATNAAGETTLDWPVEVGFPELFVVDSVLTILPETVEPCGHQILVAGDYLAVGFRGTPGCIGHFRIDGIGETFPMVEQQADTRLSRGGDVFGEDGASAIHQTPGLYTGVWQVPAALQLDSARMLVCLSRDTVITDTLFSLDSVGICCGFTECVQLESAGKVSINAGGVPTVVELTDSVQILRFGQRLGYLTTFQPAGVRAVLAGGNADWARLRLAPGHTGWVEKSKTRVLPPGTPVPGGLISYIRTRSRDKWTDVTLNLNSRLPFKVTTDPDRPTVCLTVFGATTNTDWVRYDPSDELIDRIDWNQDEPGVYRLTVHLNRGPLWGYETDYRNGQLVLAIRKPPDLFRGLRGVTICVDPGHALATGAVGPTGLTEKEVNLALALQLRRELEAEGATVVMTRTADVEVGLYDRPAIARAAEADIFISVHNNAVPDGINPYFHHGTSSYYYHPYSQSLARSVHQRLLRATRLPDFGVYHANFAVLRPTQYPSVLVECAFMIIPAQEEKLRESKFQRRIAREIARGLKDFIESARRTHGGR